jgi:ubiquinone/menaquinone biosynthesis C-methylase UbiE
VPRETDLAEERSPHRALVPFLDGDWVGVDVAADSGPPVAIVRIVCGDVRRLPFSAGAFDGVLSTSTLDHSADPAEMNRSLLELKRVLRPAGTLTWTMDNRRNPAIRARSALPRLARAVTGQPPSP